MKKFLLGSHRKGNIGHTFMSLGMEEALFKSYGKNTIIEHIEQHNHFSVLKSNSILQFVDRIPHGKLKFIRNIFLSNLGVKIGNYYSKGFSSYDGFLECGGPNLRPNIIDSLELQLMYKFQMAVIFNDKVPCLDLGVGSCIPFNSSLEIFKDVDKDFWNEIFDITVATSVRDKLAFDIFTKFGRQPYLIPCAAFLSSGHWEKKGIYNNRLKQYVVINYQKLGSNETWGQNIDSEKWKNTIIKTYSQLSKFHKVIFLCHNRVEYDLAHSLNLGAEIILPESIDEYGRIISNAKVAIVNRVHAAIPLASYGIPSVCIGNDSRLGALEQLGLSTHFTNEIDSEILINNVNILINKLDDEFDRLNELKLKTFELYNNLFQCSIK